MTKTYTYKGQTIAPCERAAGEHRGRWVVWSYHATGTPYADELCAHYQSLSAAREGIREATQYAEVTK